MMNQFAGQISGEWLVWLTMAGRLLIAFALGVLVTRIYRWTHHREAKPPDSFLTTLALLTILITMSTQVIGDNVARAFSLVGALSIVRFRTAVQDTRDIAFVICAVVVGMAVGAGYLAVALTGLPVVGLAAYVLRPRQPTPFTNKEKRTVPEAVSVTNLSYQLEGETRS